MNKYGETMLHRVNIGCGINPTKNWINFDNSFSIKLAKKNILFTILKLLGMLRKEQISNIQFIKENHIKWADATKKIPLPKNSCEVIYSSHMVEHLTKSELKQFLSEVKRVLHNGGIIRLAIPDLKYHINCYTKNLDADEFIKSLGLALKEHKSFKEKLQHLIIGDRGHKWMYDGKSMQRLLNENGFSNAEVMAPGKSNIKNYGDLNLNERVPESVFIEAYKQQ